MTAYEQDWIPLDRPNTAGERTFRVLAGLGTVAFLVYLSATLAGAVARATLSLAFAILLSTLPFVAWWAYMRSRPPLRTTMLVLALAASCALVGGGLWQGFYIANGNVVPKSPGIYDYFFLVARILSTATIVIAMRTVIAFRIAALDACVITAAGIALGAPFIRHGLAGGTTVASGFTLNQPVLSIITLMLLVSAALGSPRGFPRSVALFAASEVPLMAGNLIYSYSAVQGSYVDDRWANLAWAASAILAILGGSVIGLQIDRPIRLPAESTIPNHPSGSRPMLLVSLGALALTLGVATYGLLIASHGLAIVGVVASCAIGTALTFRARGAIRSVEEAYRRLDAAMAETEHARDHLERTNEELGRANAQIQAQSIASGAVLNLADERTDGRLRSLIEKTASELVELLEELMKPRGPG